MKRKLLVASLFLCILFCQLICVNQALAAENELLEPYEYPYFRYGYTSLEEAVSEAEQHFKQNLKLPYRIPPLEFTHIFARFNQLQGERNDSLEITFISENFPAHHYKIDVRPIQYKITVSDKKLKGVYSLNNGTEALLIDVPVFHVLAFEHDHWQYMLGVDKRASDKVTVEALVEIANSLVAFCESSELER
ncbi:hypothetical protein J40TS1_24900 [Paenibacillus montaniterrae]|uniref:DUF4367 domain-containing protein n=1 Tax=Paenibacillus montaniterrae TaxID=429341 RepID=A0A919YU09_9BACL|nr:hypothetical protein [Paenibacillus montaniterrae]GIP16848.1 hypothetical protein J40TS1_24900 [Paenibacillus montaniterrae]